ncbi:MAG: hypothetical protein R3F14_02180 [Polyangiaceae bacterium]
MPATWKPSPLSPPFCQTSQEDVARLVVELEEDVAVVLVFLGDLRPESDGVLVGHALLAGVLLLHVALVGPVQIEDHIHAEAPLAQVIAVSMFCW